MYDVGGTYVLVRSFYSGDFSLQCSILRTTWTAASRTSTSRYTGRTGHFFEDMMATCNRLHIAGKSSYSQRAYCPGSVSLV